VVGVTVDAFLDRKANGHLTVEHSVPDLLERLRVLTEEPDGFLALPGGIGTAAEVFLAWNLLSLRLRSPAPLVLMGNGLETILRQETNPMGIPPEQFQWIRFAHNPDEAVDIVLGGAS
jgi:predicted Rossmann-fold nucleotide-binding protein